MGVFARPDSPWLWIYLETAPRGQQKQKTAIRVGTTTTQRRENRRLADQVYHQQMAELAARIHHLPTAPATITFGAYATTYARDVLSHHRGYEREQEIVKTLLEAFGPLALTAIDRERVQAWMTMRRKAVSGSTVNREVGVLKPMLRAAVPKYLTAYPLTGLKKLPEVPPTRRLMSPAEEIKILKHLRPDDRAILLVGLDTLTRLGDILDLRWEDDHGKTLYIRDPKDPTQGRPYSVPISARLRQALDQLGKQRGPGPYIFPKRRTSARPSHWARAVRMALQAACVAARIDYGRKHGGITFHWATRRTGATRMLQRGAELKAVQAIGHWKRPDVMLEIYAEASSQAARQAVELVSQIPAHSRLRRR